MIPNTFRIVIAAVVLLILLQVIGCLDVYLHAAPLRSPPEMNPESNVQVIVSKSDAGRGGRDAGAGTSVPHHPAVADTSAPALWSDDRARSRVVGASYDVSGGSRYPTDGS